MESLSGNYTDGYKFYKNENGDICFRNIDGSYLSVARSMPFDKLLELENKSIPSIDFIVESKYTQKNINKYINKCMVNKIKYEKCKTIIKPYFKKANKRLRGKSQILDFYVCTFCRTHHADDTDECADCISNYERDIKYTNNKIFEISNDNKIGLIPYNIIINTINNYKKRTNYRGFRYINISIVGITYKITMYFIDSNNKITKEKFQYDILSDEFDDMYDEYEYKYEYGYNYLEMDYIDYEDIIN